MFLLSKLLTLKNSIESNYQDYLSADRDFNVDRIELDKSQYQFEELTKKTPVGDKLEKSHQLVISAAEQYCQNIDVLMEFVRSEIKREHEQYCQTVNQLIAEMDYEINKHHDKLINKIPLLKRNDITELGTIISIHTVNLEVDNLVKFHVNKYVDWRYPGLLFRPSISSCVEDMVGFDPLYLAEHHIDYVESEAKKFNEAYQHRLRPYVITDQSDDPILSKLPQGQFGCVVAHNFFKFKSYQITCQYLKEVYALLKPGGVFIFTFNDCDFIKAIELVETRESTYIPGRLIKQTAIEIGYQIIHYITVDEHITCVEMKKPGELSSIRGGQTLARIMPI